MLSRGIFLAIPLPNSGTLGHARVYGQVSTLEQVGVAMPLTNFQDLEQTMTPSDPISPTTNRQPPIAPFLRAMLDILMKEDQTIVRWTADGNAFEIVDMDGLTEYLLPKYFKHNRYQSFQRQLNYFGFRKWTKSQAVLCTFNNKVGSLSGTKDALATAVCPLSLKYSIKAFLISAVFMIQSLFKKMIQPKLID